MAVVHVTAVRYWPAFSLFIFRRVQYPLHFQCTLCAFVNFLLYPLNYDKISVVLHTMAIFIVMYPLNYAKVLLCPLLFKFVPFACKILVRTLVLADICWVKPGSQYGRNTRMLL